MQIWTTEIKQIEILLESFIGKIPELEKELELLIKSDDPNVLMLYSRRCLEVIITDLCVKELNRPRRTEPLKGIIDKLNREEKVPSHIITSMDGLNSLSTYGAHPKDFDPEQVKPALNNLAIVIKWYLKYKGISIHDNAETTLNKAGAKQIDKSVKIFPKRRKKLAIYLIVIAVLIIAFLALYLFKVINLVSKESDYSNLEKSIAVLPFKNDTPDTSNTYFVDGLMEEILNNLQKISDLRVISRTSVEQFRNITIPITEIAKKLNVNYVVEGSGQKYGNQFKLRVQLIRANQEDHLWGETYQRNIVEANDFFKIQSEIAGAIAYSLNTIITPSEKKLLEKTPTSNIGAYEAYLMGRFYGRNLNKRDLEIAMQFFNLALERDPGFALAYASIGSTWRAMEQMGIVSPSVATPKAEAALIKALELDTTYSDVYRIMGGLKTWSKWDWKGGEELFRKALEINPKNTDALANLSHLLMITGRPDEAMKHIQTAIDLDPLNSKIKSFYGIDLMFTLRYDESIKAFREALDLNPNQEVASSNIVPALFLSGHLSEAMEMQRSRWKNNVEYLKILDEGYAESGFRGACKKLADYRVSMLETRYSSPYAIAIQFSMAEDNENAILWLENALKEHNPNMPYLMSPVFEKLRDNPRFKEITRKMGLPYE